MRQSKLRSPFEGSSPIAARSNREEPAIRAGMGTGPHTGPSGPSEAAEPQRLTEEVVQALSKLESPRLVGRLREIWRGLGPDDRERLLTALHAAGHPGVLEAFDLAVKDEDARVRNVALALASSLSFEDFTSDREAYATWRVLNRGRSLEEAARAGAAQCVEKIRWLASPASEPADPQAFADRAMEEMRLQVAISLAVRYPRTRQALMDTGLLSLAELWFVSGGERELAAAGQVVGYLDPGADWIQRVVVPVLRSEPNRRRAAIFALGGTRGAWAFDLILPYLSDPDEPTLLAAAGALALISGPRAVGEIINALQRPLPPHVHTELCQKLTWMTGVSRDEGRDRAWWLKWWESNRARFEALAR